MFVKWSGPVRRGRQVRYLQIVESYVEAGAHRHRLIANLGELSQRQIETMVRSFNRLLDVPYTFSRNVHTRSQRSRVASHRRPA